MEAVIARPPEEATTNLGVYAIKNVVIVTKKRNNPPFVVAVVVVAVLQQLLYMDDGRFRVTVQVSSEFEFELLVLTEITETGLLLLLCNLIIVTISSSLSNW